MLSFVIQQLHDSGEIFDGNAHLGNGRVLYFLESKTFFFRPPFGQRSTDLDEIWRRCVIAQNLSVQFDCSRCVGGSRPNKTFFVIAIIYHNSNYIQWISISVADPSGVCLSICLSVHHVRVLLAHNWAVHEFTRNSRYFG